MRFSTLPSWDRAASCVRLSFLYPADPFCSASCASFHHGVCRSSPSAAELISRRFPDRAHVARISVPTDVLRAQDLLPHASLVLDATAHHPRHGGREAEKGFPGACRACRCTLSKRGETLIKESILSRYGSSFGVITFG
jgi:hypothetical protein